MRARAVLRSHSESITLEFERDITLEQAREALAAAPGVKLVDDLDAQSPHDRWPMPLDTSDQDLIWVGRVRRDISNPDELRGITFWCCGDQIRKGAATNAVQIAKLAGRVARGRLSGLVSGSICAPRGAGPLHVGR